MAARRIELRELAATDIERTADHYYAEGGEALALRFIDAVEHTLGQIGRSPQIGSLRLSYELEIPELRARPFNRFPYSVFYVPDNAHVDVWRVLHSRRDIPTAFQDHTE